MKEMSDNRFWVHIVTILAIAVVCIAITVASYNAYTTKLYTEQGYSMQTLQGSQGPVWVKK